MNFIKRLINNIKTFILLNLPLWVYVWIVKKVDVGRMQDYSGILGNNPKAYIVFNDIILVDLSSMQI